MKKLFLLLGFVGFALASYGVGYHNCFQNNENVVIPLRCDAQTNIDAQTGKEILTFSVWYATNSTSNEIMVYCSHPPRSYGAEVYGTVSNGREDFVFIFEGNMTEGPVPFIYAGAQIVSCSVSPSENDRYIFQVNY